MPIKVYIFLAAKKKKLKKKQQQHKKTKKNLSIYRNKRRTLINEFNFHFHRM